MDPSDNSPNTQQSNGPYVAPPAAGDEPPAQPAGGPIWPISPPPASAQAIQTGSGAPPPGPSSTPAATSNPGGSVGINPTQQAGISNAAQVAYQYAEMQLYKIPMLQSERDKMALQAAEQAAVLASQDKRLSLIDQPMLGLNRDQLLQSIAHDNAQLSLQKQLGMGDLGIRASQAFNNADIQRQGLAQQGFINAAQLAQGQQKIGLTAGQMADQNYLDTQKNAMAAGALADTSELGRASTSLQAANQIANQGIQEAQLEAQLNSNPRNAFQAQAAMRGLDARGLSNSLGAISGAATPSSQAMQGQAQNGSLASLYGDTRAAGQGQIGGVNGAGGAQYTAPNPLDVQGQIAQKFANTSGGQGYRVGSQVGQTDLRNPYGQGAKSALWQMNQSLTNPYQGTAPIYSQAVQQQNAYLNDPMYNYSNYATGQSKTGMNINSPTPDQVRADTTGSYTAPKINYGSENFFTQPAVGDLTKGLMGAATGS